MIIQQSVQTVTSETFEAAVISYTEKGFYLHSITVTQWTKDVATQFLLIFHKESQQYSSIG